MNPTLTLDPKALNHRELHHHLVSAVAPRPICFASTIDSAGNVNLSPYSFFNVFSANPPILVFSPVRSGRDNSHKHTFTNMEEVPEVVINIVNYSMVEQMSLTSTSYEKGVNEFVKAGLTQVASEQVQPPRVGESPVAFECIVDQVIELGDTPGAGNLVIARVVLIHIQEQYLNPEGQLDTHKLDLVARMGGSWYCRAIKEAIFEIPKPLRTRGIGVDQLPESVRNSSILTGNDLARLGNTETLPDRNELSLMRELPEVQQLNASKSHPTELEKSVHLLAKEWLDNGETAKALKILLYYEQL